MDKELKEWVESEPGKEWLIKAGYEKPEELKERQLVPLKAAWDLEKKKTGDGDSDPPPIIAAPDFDLDELKIECELHADKIEAVLFEHEDDCPRDKYVEIKAKAKTGLRDLRKKAINEKWSGLKYKAEAIEAAAAIELELVRVGRPSGPQITGSGHDVSNEVIEAALCMNLSVGKDDDFEKQYKPEVLEAAHRDYRTIGLQELIIMAASVNGYHARAGQRINNGNLREVMRYAFTPIHASSFSTVSLPSILENVANKELLAGFMEEDQMWREISDIKSVSDFKTYTAYRLLDNMEYEQLGPNGEIAHGQVGGETYTRSADTYAKMFALTRTMIINDDLGALDDLRTRLGRGAARKMRRLFWETFIDNSSFFTSARANYIDGATSNLGTDGVGLQEGITAYRKLKTTDKKKVAKSSPRNPAMGTVGPPTKLLIPLELEFIADRLYTSDRIVVAGSTDFEGGDANIHRNKYQPIVVQELSDSDYTGNSQTAWYLFGSVLNPMVVSFLNGVETPTVESADADFNQLGIQLRGYHDFGCDQSEWISGVKSKGAA